MKKLFAILLAMALLLSGCASQAKTAEATKPQQETEPTPVIPEDEGPNFGIYVADSQIEQDTQGAVREYDVGEDSYAIAYMGDELLLFSGVDGTTLTLLREDGESVSTELTGEYLYLDGLTVQIGEEGLCYYSLLENTVIFLDSELEQVDALPMPEDMAGVPAISPDQERIYYFTEDALNYIEVKTGISRFLKECTFSYQAIMALHFDGSLIECCVGTDTDTENYFIDTATGELRYTTAENPCLSTDGQWHVTTYYDGFQQLYLFGDRDERSMCLVPREQDGSVIVLPDTKQVLTTNLVDDKRTLSLYSLADGSRYAEVAHEELSIIWSQEWDEENGRLWLLTSDDDLEQIQLYLWDPALSPTGDTECYTSPYYTAEDPDTEGLERIAQQAKEMSSQYGVKIQVYEEAAADQPEDFTFVAAYQVPLYEHYLAVLDRVLACYPEGFLKKLGTTSDNGKLTISLVAAAYGDNELGAVSEADGVQFFLDGDTYLTLVMNGLFEGTAYHELFHVIDTYVINNETSYDNWDSLNPPGFEYDYDYLANGFREDYQYLQDEDRWFIDMYSMSYGKEDRARIMEYAMQAGNESYFASPNMQAKLQTLCSGIRKAFGLKNYEGELLWEQYLAQ